MTRRLLPWVPAVLWAGVIFWLSSRPSLPAPDVPYVDKAAHFGAFALLGALLAFAADRSVTGSPRRPLALAAGLGVLYGALDEVHQMYVPGRSPDVLDWAADAAGVAAACVLYSLWRSRRAPAKAAGRGGTSFSRA